MQLSTIKSEDEKAKDDRDEDMKQESGHSKMDTDLNQSGGASIEANSSKKTVELGASSEPQTSGIDSIENPPKESTNDKKGVTSVYVANTNSENISRESSLPSIAAVLHLGSQFNDEGTTEVVADAGIPVVIQSPPSSSESEASLSDHASLTEFQEPEQEDAETPVSDVDVDEDKVELKDENQTATAEEQAKANATAAAKEQRRKYRALHEKIGSTETPEYLQILKTSMRFVPGENQYPNIIGDPNDPPNLFQQASGETGIVVGESENQPKEDLPTSTHQYKPLFDLTSPADAAETSTQISKKAHQNLLTAFVIVNDAAKNPGKNGKKKHGETDYDQNLSIACAMACGGKSPYPPSLTKGRFETKVKTWTPSVSVSIPLPPVESVSKPNVIVSHRMENFASTTTTTTIIKELIPKETLVGIPIELMEVIPQDEKETEQQQQHSEAPLVMG